MSRSRSAPSWVARFCLAGWCLVSVSACAPVAASAATSLLSFAPQSGKYPYHLIGSGGKTSLETLAGSVIAAEKVDALAVVLSPTLFNLHLEFLKTTGPAESKCSNTSGAETILSNLLGHFGTSDPGQNPAVLLLVPSGFEFTCTSGGGKEKVKVRGAVIGTITKPALEEEVEELTFLFSQTKGKQEYTSFLLGSTLLTNQLEETAVGAGAFEDSGQRSEPITFKAGAGQGVFALESILNPSRKFSLKVDKRILKKGETATFTVFANAAGDVATLIVTQMAGQYEEIGVETCAKAYAMGEECTFKLKYLGTGDTSAIVDLIDNEGNRRSRTLEGRP